MENAVIYPRYSSHGQNDMTIEGQIRICTEFAHSRGLNVIKIYPEKAKSASKDTHKRKAFQQMLHDAESGAFQYIIVYKFDRFARNRFESMMIKHQLKEKCGVKVLSALEPVTDDEGGELYEMFVEWNDEKYSQRLSVRIRDGSFQRQAVQRQNFRQVADKCEIHGRILLRRQALRKYLSPDYRQTTFCRGTKAAC